MTPVRLIIAILIYAGTCVACTWTPTASSTQRISGVGASAACNGQDFASRVLMVLPDKTTQAPTAAMQTDLSSAYCKASQRFQHHLDNIDEIYIDATHCPNGDLTQCTSVLQSAWGQRMAGGYTQIGIPAGLWPSSQASAQLYPDYEAAVLSNLVQLWWRGSALQPKFSTTAHSSGSENTSWMTVLAALAHEMGHVQWYEAAARSGYGFKYDFTRLTKCNFFIAWTENTDTDPATNISGYLEPPGRWRLFGTSGNVSDGGAQPSSNDHSSSPTLNNPLDSNSYAKASNDQQRATLLNTIYSTPWPWASFWAGDTPDEDFVESFKLAVLNDAGLLSMQISIPKSDGSGTFYTQDTPWDYNIGNKTTLSKKIKCIKRWS
jgi:hypothetical protein